jgi:Family of unknown function (DUF5681)
MSRNLWKKGQSGNPKGRPKAFFSYVKELGTQLTAIDPNDAHKRTNGQIIVAKQVELAKMGSVRATNEILDRLMGNPPQAVAIADLRTENRDEVISSILESLKAIRDTSEQSYGDGKQTIQ